MNLKARRLIKFSNQPELTVVVDLRKSKICYTAKAMFIFINKLSFHTANIVKLQEAASIKMFYIKKNKIINNNIIVIINNKGYNILNN